MKNFEGVFPIVNTPFKDDGSIDFESQRRLVRFLIDCGAHGLALFGNASEGYTLSNQERAELMKLIIREVDGRIPVIVSSGHTGTDVAVALSREAQKAGASGVMVLPPYFFRTDGEGIFEYYQAISNAINIPIQIQDAPLMTQVAMPSSLLARMGREIEHVTYAKIEAPPTAPKVSEVMSLAQGSLILFGGLNGHFLIEELGRGSRGTMPGSDLTDVFVRIWDLYHSDQARKAREEFNRYLPLIRFELQPGLGVSVMKHNLKAGGVIATTRVRHPTRSIDVASRSELEELRQDLDLLALRWQ